MYFGSVRFFKHLIIGVVLLMIIIPVAASIVLSIDNSRKEKELEELRSAYYVSGGSSSTRVPPTAQELFELYKMSPDKSTFLKLLNEYDSKLYASFVQDVIPAMQTTTPPAQTPDAPASGGTSAAAATTPAATSVTIPTTTTAATTEPEPELPEYCALYPELYAYGTTGLVYNTDMDYLYLTFDDGPSKHTENILSYLKKYDLKATFFVVPDGSAESNALIKRIADAGHTIGVHSATHEYKKIYASVEAYLEDFKIAYDRIYEACGVKCELFRFPGGSKNDFNGETRDDIIAEMTRRGFIYFDWNVDSGDAGGATWTEMYNGILGQVKDKNRAVILMHDHNNGYNTVLVLEDIIIALKSDARHFKFDKLTKNVKSIIF